MEKLILVKIPNTKNYKPRTFTIVGDFYINICKKYLSLRPDVIDTDRFFIKYQNGVCHRAVMGIHKISSIPKEIALFLRLADVKEYTGHCLRRTSATLLVDNGGDICSLKRHGGWRSTTVAEGYIDDSLRNKNDTAMKILDVNDCNLIPMENNTTDDIREPVISTNPQQQPTLNVDHEVKGQEFNLWQNCKFENCSFKLTVHSSNTDKENV